jgi:hypothetical protein
MFANCLADRPTSSGIFDPSAVRVHPSDRVASYPRPARSTRLKAHGSRNRQRRLHPDEPPIEHPARLNCLLALLQQELASSN